MRPRYGVGVLISILVPLAAFLLGLLGPPYSLASAELTLSTMFLISGLWTLVAAFVIVEAKDRTYYSAWGVVLAGVSLFAYVSPPYAIGILIIAIIVLVLLVTFTGRSQELVTAATSPKAPAGETPAAQVRRLLRSRPQVLRRP